jgi:hypothetical protein
VNLLEARSELIAGGEAVMSDQTKTVVAYIVGVCVLVLAWTFVRTWEPPLPVPMAVKGAAAIAAPDRAGSAPAVPVARD